MGSRSALHVLMYVPNVIGYIRVLMGVLAFVDWRNMQRFSVLYAVSFVLDAADGYAARKYDQSSHFGSYLDMITDRIGTLALLVVTGISAREVSESLGLSQGATSTAINELLEWGAITSEFDSSRRCHLHSPVRNTLE